MLITQTGNNIAINVDDIDSLVEYTSTDPVQAAAGPKKWVAVGIDTGLDDIRKVKYNGSYLTDIDVADATSVGLPAGSFVLWVDAENLPKTFTLQTAEYQAKRFTINLNVG